MAESLSLVLLFLVPVGIYLIWRWRRKGLLIEDVLYAIGFISALAAIFYLPSEFEQELSKISIAILEIAFAGLCISLGYYFGKG
jgi:hypothetical protein